MKKKLWQGFIAIAVLLVVCWRPLVAAITPEIPYTATDKGDCAHYRVGFDASSVETIFLETERILGYPAAFWEEDSAYKLVSLTPAYRSHSSPPEAWIRRLEKIAKLDPGKRQNHPTLVLTREIIRGSETFCKTVIPQILAYLPRGTDISTTVHLTALTDHNDFTTAGHIVIDVSSFDHFGSAAKILNTVAHEIFHIGYWDNVFLRTEIEIENERIQTMLTALQNEGMATLVDMEVAEHYPALLHREHMLLGNELMVRWLHSQLNGLFENSSEMPAEILSEEIRKVGFGRSAFYVVGARMAQTIAARLGKDALIETIVQGPRSFISTYNRVSDKGMQVHAFETPQDLSVFQELRHSFVNQDYMEAREILSAIEERMPKPSEDFGYTINSTGYLLLHTDRPDLAIELFDLHVRYFPDNPVGYVGLGRGHLMIQNRELARDCFIRALELDPAITTATEALAKLE